MWNIETLFLINVNIDIQFDAIFWLLFNQKENNNNNIYSSAL